jgi:hypothetical protein
MSMDDDPRALLGPLDTPPPPHDLGARTLAAAAPLLAVHARRAGSRSWVRPLLVALLPLPAILAVDAAIIRGLHALLSLVLPAALSTFFVAQYALLVVLLLGLAYAAVPLLADRQARALLEDPCPSPL